MAGSGEERLPVDWTEHQSKSCPGHVYYFNSRTGAKTWNRQEVLGLHKKDKTEDFSISQLEKMLEQKREEERKRKHHSKGEKGESGEKVPAKRQKVVAGPSTNSIPVSKESQKTRSISHSEPGAKKTPAVPSHTKQSETISVRPHGSRSSSKGQQKEKISQSNAQKATKVQIGGPSVASGSGDRKLKGYKIPLKPPSSSKNDRQSEGGSRLEFQRVESDSPLKLCLRKVKTPSPPPQGDGESSSQGSSQSSHGDRPQTPQSVLELQEEEMMEWETVDMEDIIKETQRAREMVCQAMDVEEDKGEDHSPLAAPSSDLVVVIDTNVFISSLRVVTQLLETEHLRVLVPWMVVQELDSLKSSESKDTAVRARAAVRYLHSLLVSPPPNLLTQTAAHNRAVAARFQSKSPDDRILATCFDFIEQDIKIFLVSNDINLCNKALINGVKCGESDNVVEVLSKNGDLFATEQTLPVGTEDNCSKEVLNDLIKRARDITRDILEGVFIAEFRRAYGEELWKTIVSIKPEPSSPHWPLRDLFTLYSKHHIAVFGMSFPKSGNPLKARLQSVKERLSVSDCRRLQEVVTATGEVLMLIDTIKEKEDYEGLVSSCRERMTDLCLELGQLQSKDSSKKTIIDSLTLDSRQQKIESYLTAVWQIILAFTSAFAEAYKVPHNLPQTERTVELGAQPQEQLSTFYRAVDGVHGAMRNIVGDNVTPAALTEFYDKLTGFRSSLGRGWDSSHLALDERISRQELQWFLTRPDNAVMVSNGLEQITEFRQTLIRCIWGHGDGN